MGGLDNSHLFDDLDPLWDYDSPIFTFAEPNVNPVSGPYEPSWHLLLEDIISVGAWNVTTDNFSMFTDWDNIHHTDVLATGMVEFGNDTTTVAGLQSFGTSLPRLMSWQRSLIFTRITYTRF